MLNRITAGLRSCQSLGSRTPSSGASRFDVDHPVRGQPEPLRVPMIEPP